ncbi:hypothetical protein IFM89_038764 [Coptis chinensis]|uniref:Pectinesterase n=1 Tax=Coptis chinensis TaxID=261450 RepID=A0A835IK38_9MAGN|nr:hypothetical protein IFM89_038764 [Coptis chinensis]
MNSATLWRCDRFIPQGITIRNTAGPISQVVALRSSSDIKCGIYGTLDFIFGDATAVFQSCTIYVRNGDLRHGHVITAQGKGKNRDGVISVLDSRVTAAPAFRPYMDKYPVYLGRTWGNFSNTVFIRTFLGSFIAPEGWLKWSKKLYLDGTVYYGEYMNYGPGAWTDRRVKWGGYHLLSTEYEVSQFTVEKLIGGLSWLTATKVPFYADH